jgi:hypothetical protein
VPASHRAIYVTLLLKNGKRPWMNTTSNRAKVDIQAIGAGGDMSNLWFNIRFGTRHFQFSRDWEVSFRVNPYWLDNPDGRWVVVYCAFGRHFGL